MQDTVLDGNEKHKQLLQSMNTRPFWHYCEVCGKKEYITAEEAFNDGWDYPPNMGAFGVLSPRTCGSCPITGTLWLKVNNLGGMVTESMLTPEELKTLLRIKSEPESLLGEED